MKKALIIIGIVAAVIAVAVIGGLNYASRTIEDAVLQALGPESEMSEVQVRLTDVELSDIKVGAPKGWPADTALKAKRVVLQPRLSQIFSEKIELTDVTIEDAYISAARPKEGGGIRVMPGLKEKGKKAEKGNRGADIRVVHLKNCTIDLYDASTAIKPVRIRVEGVSGTIKDIEIPGLGAKTEINLSGSLPGPTHRGKVTVRGWVDVAKKSSELTTQVRGADLAVFDAYVVRKAKIGISQGTFDLDLKTTVRNNQLTAPGTLTINSLKLDAADTPGQALANFARRAAVGATANEEEKIVVEFTLDGNLDDPKFSLAGEGAIKLGLAFIRAFGLNFEGLVRAFYLIVNGLGTSVGSAIS